MAVRVLAAAILAALAMAAPAQAAPGYQLATWLDRSQAIAERVWNQPCSGQVEVVLAPLPLEHDAETLVNDATRPFTNCSIVLNLMLMNRPAYLCTVLLHEYGHAAGVPHSDNPRSVMYPWWVENDHRCKWRRS